MAGKTILLTGASSGFGLHAVKLLLGRGHRVIAGVRGGAERLKKLAEGDSALSDALASGRLAGLDLHMDKPETFGAAEKYIDESCGSRLDVLVNNAGYGLMGPVELHSEEELRHQFEVNFFGPVFLTQRLLPRLKSAKGTILNVSSIVGVTCFPFYGSYSASKHALDSYTEGLYYDMAPFGVRVGLIEPGGFKTDFNKASFYGEKARSPDSGYHSKIENFKAAARRRSETTGGDPAAVARLIVRLCEARRVPLRTLAGADAKSAALLKRLLPESLRARLMSFVFNRFVFKS
ncbi:MAG: SDR family oxidoreductase [Elusimicrobiota bacterium]